MENLQHIYQQQTINKAGNIVFNIFVCLTAATESIEPMYSEYQNILRPAPSPIASTPASILEIALQVLT